MLIVVLIVCLGLVSLALVFGHSMLMAYRGADNEIAGRQADAAIDGAAQYAENILLNVATPGSTPDPATYQSEAVSVGDGAFWFIGEPADGAEASDQPAFGLVDEASKLNLNTVTPAMMDNLPGMTDDLAQAITEWKTSATAATGSSVSLNTVKQGPFESVDELALVNGGTDLSLLYGDDLNLNHCLDPEESSTSVGGAQYTAGFFEYFTAFTREPNLRANGQKRIPIATGMRFNTMSGILNTILGNGRGTSVAQRIWGAQPPTTVLTFASVLDLAIRGGLSETELVTVSDRLSMSGNDFVSGLVNVNTAPATVLACLPGFTADTAAQVVTTRQQAGTAYTDLYFLISILGNANAGRAGRYVTTHSYQTSVDVAAVGRYGRGYRRVRFVIDTSTGTPQIVYRRNLASLGWALGDDARQSLASQGQLGQPGTGSGTGTHGGQSTQGVRQ